MDSAGEELADAPLRIQVTDFPDGQILALSYAHTICDGCSIIMLLQAWCAAFAGVPVTDNLTFDRGMLQPRGSPPHAWPEEWRRYHTLRGGSPSWETYIPAMIIYCRSAEACRALKGRYWAEGRVVSTNDALTGELAESLDAIHVIQ